MRVTCTHLFRYVRLEVERCDLDGLLLLTREADEAVD